MSVWSPWQIACVLQVEYEYGELFPVEYDCLRDDPGYVIDFLEVHLAERFLRLVDLPVRVEIPSNPL